MKMKKINLVTLIVVLSVLFTTIAEADPPANFPGSTVATTSSKAVAPGYIFLSVTDWYQAATNQIWGFKPLPDGELHYGEMCHTYSSEAG